MINPNTVFFFLDGVILIGVVFCVVLLLLIRSDTKRGADSLGEIEDMFRDTRSEAMDQ